MALRMVLMLRIFFSLNIALLALVLIEIFLIPNQLQLYLDTCTFRKERSNNAIETEEKEVEVMQRALEGTL